MRTIHLPGFESLFEREPPADALALPSMMSLSELKLLYGLARDAFEDRGLIVDAGVFWGASTVCLGAGLSEGRRLRPRDQLLDTPIRSYELGVVHPGMRRFFDRHRIDVPLRIGDDFSRYLEANTASVADSIHLEIGDILERRWSGAPIEILFLDLCKDEAITSHVFRELYPSLTIGAFVIQQDYFMDSYPFLKIFQECLSDCFDYIGEVHSSAVFRVSNTPSIKSVDPDPNLALDDAAKMDLLDQARNRSIDADRHLLCDLGKVRFLASIGRHPEAQALLGDIRARYRARLGTSRRLARALKIANDAANGVSLPWDSGLNENA